MPSPIVHVATGVAVYQLWQRGRPRSRRIGGIVPFMLAVCVFLSVMPDLDAAVGIALGNLGRYHNNFAGTPLFGLLAALAVGAAVGLLRRPAAVSAFSLTYVCYQLHVLMDFLTVGRGLMILWPFSDERIQPPFHLFYGLRWSDGVVSERHFITIFSELAFVAVALILARIWSRRGASAGVRRG